MNLIRRLTAFSPTDSDVIRRRQLLNILLLGLAGLLLVAALLEYIFWISGDRNLPDSRSLLLGTTSAGAFLGMLAILFINNRVSSLLGSWTFLLVITGIVAFVDTPDQVVNGRSLLLFAIPILAAGAVLSPYNSFLMAAIASAVVTGITLRINSPTSVTSAIGVFAVPVPSMIGFFVVAIISWLLASSLERVIHDLRTINEELDQRVADRTLQLSESLTREQAEARKNQAILQSIADGVVVFDEVGHAIVANPAVSGLLERPVSGILGANIDQLLNLEADGNHAEVKALFAPTAVQQAPVNVEWSGKTLSLSVAPLLGSQAGGTAGSVAVFRDVTREAEVSRMKSIIVAMVSHELRTPLNAVQGLAEVLQQGVYGQLADKQQQTIDRIILNTKRLLSLVRDLLDQAQIEAGTLKIESVLFSPAEMVDSVREVVSGLARDKGLQLGVKIDEALPTSLMGDPQRLGQILINLTNNAIKFTETGSVNVRLYQADQKHWALEVADTGPGIPISAEAYIFDAFRQIDSSASRRHGGIGLGLSIVKRLVTVMGGEIKLSSRLGRGTTFTVLLPLIQPSEHLLN